MRSTPDRSKSCHYRQARIFHRRFDARETSSTNGSGKPGGQTAGASCPTHGLEGCATGSRLICDYEGQPARLGELLSLMYKARLIGKYLRLLAGIASRREPILMLACDCCIIVCILDRMTSAYCEIYQNQIVPTGATNILKCHTPPPPRNLIRQPRG